jgi:hypothetical protein
MYSMRKTTYLLAIVGVFTIISYQNCSQELGQLGDTVTKASDGIPFPIEVDVDTIARMSCFSSNLNNGENFFSYKAAFNSPNTSGVKRSSEFDAFVSSESGNAYENRRKFLKESVKIQGLKLQFTLKVPAEMSTNDGIFRNSFQHTDFKDAALIENLVNYDVPVSISTGNYMSAKLDLRTQDIMSADDLYNIDGGGKHLTLALDYVKLSDPNFSVGPYTFNESQDTNLIYGNKYKVYFADAKEKRVSRIGEQNSVTNIDRPGVFWSCSSYKIIRAGDPVDTCSSQSPVDLVASGTIENQRLNKLLGPGWKRYGDCIRHDSAIGCYGEVAGGANVPVAYNLTLPCSDASGSSLVCANFLSVCHKNAF